MIEFDLDGKAYRADKLNAFQQLHVSRKIAPLIPALIPAFMEVAQLQGTITSNLDRIADLLRPVAQGLATLPDADAEYVIGTCLSVVRRQQADVWTPVWNAGQKTTLFEDMNDLGLMMRLVLRVIQESLGPFIQGLVTSHLLKAPDSAS